MLKAFKIPSVGKIKRTKSNEDPFRHSSVIKANTQKTERLQCLYTSGRDL
jgi:hypothetical protein